MNDRWKQWLEPYAAAMRELALESDRRGEPHERYRTDPFFRPLHFFNTPSMYWDGIQLGQGETVFGTRSMEFVQFAEELSFGDPGLYLALPGPNLAGTVVGKMGTNEQQDVFFSLFCKRVAWSAFAITEPSAGSDLANLNMTAELQEDGTYLLNGTKKYIGNGAVAERVIVFSRVAKKNAPVKLLPSGMGIEAFLIPTPAHDVKQACEGTLGLKAARLGVLEFQNYRAGPDQVLGHHLSPLRRGFRGALETFYHMRPTTAALALGLCRAIADYVQTHVKLDKNEEIQTARWAWEMDRARQLIYFAARQADEGRFDSTYPSMAKRHMNQLVLKIVREASQIMGVCGLREHPLLEKWFRDAKMIEFMEGTTNILSREVSQQIGMNGWVLT
ncbi:acyl-CoA dehydrogenase [Paenibacillus sp. FSL H8-0537]|uniref:acyl-CoA dehydrogenase family protein n=1 Tax=Paenibacillus sp. FSL H8-0537 TaxID=2921399 RepID=UPI0031019A48